MQVTPYIRTVKVQGGTLYTFQSASRDVTEAFNNPNRNFRFSRFALLDIPDMKTPDSFRNTVQFNTIDGAIFNDDFSDFNRSLAESLQNYALNMESLLLDMPTYDNSIKKTVAEKVFFKWLKEMGAIRYQQADSSVNASTSFRATEESDSSTGSTQYSRVVKYVGNCDVTNSVVKNGRSYSEVYLYVPNSHGGTPQIMFKSESDANYYPSMSLNGSSDVIQGREITDIHPAGLSIQGFFDYDNPIAYTASTNADWHGQTATNSYFTDNAFGDAGNTDITKVATDYSLAFSDVNYRRSRLDGVCIDFDIKNYTRFNTDLSIQDITKTNELPDAQNFQFNAVLLYYDVWDSSTPDDVATNLFGVLFLDNIKPLSANGGYIPRLTKYRQDRVTRTNGNSYGFTLNLNFDTSVEDATVVNSINDYNTFALELFSEATTRLRQISLEFQDSSQRISELETAISQLYSLIPTQGGFDELSQRIASVESALANANMAISDSQAIFDLIERMNERIASIFSGTAPLSISYNFNSFIQGEGVVLSKVNGKLAISSPKQEYNSISTSVLNTGIANANMLLLGSFTNYLRVSCTAPSFQDILRIRIDDSRQRWKTGQKARISFSAEIVPNGLPIAIYTDFDGKFGAGAFGILVGVLNASELSKRPIIEVVCQSELDYTFFIDLIA